MANTSETRGEYKKAGSANVHVGPAGWSYRDWNGVVYPNHRPAGFHEAEYLAEYFSTIEINSSFYRAPRVELARVWARRLSGRPNFRFTAKLYRGFTHDGRLDRRAVREFSEGLEPLIDAGLLGCLLMQFPWSFRMNDANLRYLLELARAFSQYPLVAEFRHAGWNNRTALAALADHGVGFCNIDQPRLNQCLGPTAHVTSPIGYVRLHGRNNENWFGETDVASRYDYLYSRQQLEQWKPRIERIAAQAETTYVVTNNHFQGKAVVNALEILASLEGEPVEVPTSLLEHYPELSESASNLPSQRSLFFARNRRVRPLRQAAAPPRRMAGVAAVYARA